jgi:glycine betaine/proline transport system permease protein/glycine betaine/proline transport system substrate-binding protein
LLALLLLALALPAQAAEEPYTVRFADANWDSVKFHNALAGYIAESAFGLAWEEVPGSTAILHEAILKGDMDVQMEAWTDNMATYAEDLAAGRFTELGVNFDDNMQGLYVPRYVIEGDPERGIAPMAPGLKTVEDLKKYPDVFPDAESPGKGRIYGAIPGWDIDNVMHKKYEYYGLDAMYNYVQPGSEAALAAALSTAYEKGEPIVGYYWEPTWLMGLYDFVLLQDAPYTPEGFPKGETACPAVRVVVQASNAFVAAQPAYAAFLDRYHTSSPLTSEALSYIQDSGASYTQAAEWFLREHDELLDTWLTGEEAAMVRAALGGGERAAAQSNFPLALHIDTAKFDRSVKDYARGHDSFFGGIKTGLIAFVRAFQWALQLLPWWLLLALVMVGSYFATHKLTKAVFYGALLFLIGLFGLWDLMMETLSVVLAAVVIALVLGFPIGVLLSASRRANRVMRPVLDTMQTMPVFVYLIPAVMFFSIGKAPAVIATVIYAVVPVIRLTALGILQVDAEVVEASRAFGATRLQTLIKVQIPQAMPTIMTGVNQTLMMAMAMVVTCSMIGASGLGIEVLIGVNRNEIGRGLIAGCAVVILAVLMDRLTQGLAKQKPEPKKKATNTDIIAGEEA